MDSISQYHPSRQFGIICKMKVQYLVWGKVEVGNKRGKDLGFPTANIALHKNIPDGVYISEIRVSGEKLTALAFVGAAKTFGETTKKVESYILNFNKNIYGKWVTVKLIKKIRGNMKFKSKKELIAQMNNDLVFAKQSF